MAGAIALCRDTELPWSSFVSTDAGAFLACRGLSTKSVRVSSTCARMLLIQFGGPLHVASMGGRVALLHGGVACNTGGGGKLCMESASVQITAGALAGKPGRRCGGDVTCGARKVSAMCVNAAGGRGHVPWGAGGGVLLPGYARGALAGGTLDDELGLLWGRGGWKRRGCDRARCVQLDGGVRCEGLMGWPCPFRGSGGKRFCAALFRFSWQCGS